MARDGARGAKAAAVSIVLAFGIAAVALLPRLELLRYATASGYVDPDGIGSLLFGDRRGLVGRFGVSHSEIATLYLGAGDTGARAACPGGADLCDGFLRACLFGWLTRLAGVGLGPDRLGPWIPLPLVRTVTGHEPVRGIVLALLCASVLAAFALPEVEALAGRDVASRVWAS